MLCVCGVTDSVSELYAFLIRVFHGFLHSLEENAGIPFCWILGFCTMLRREFTDDVSETTLGPIFTGDINKNNEMSRC